MKMTIKDLLCDRKEGAFDSQDKIGSILKFFVGDLENKVFNEKAYRQLGWYENDYFDVINSFYTTFVCALVAYAKDIEDIKKYWKNLGKDWGKKPYAFGGLLTEDISRKGDTELKYLVRRKDDDKWKEIYNNISKETYAYKALDAENIQHDILEDFKSTNNGELLEELAKLSHCVANFMPCPSWDFNAAKGASIAHEFFPVFVDLIQDCIANHNNLNYGDHKLIEFKYLDQWRDWLIANVDKYCLSCYYEVEDGKLKGIPLFKAQRLDHPYPDGVDEVKECLSNMINCIKTRADELLCRINEQGGQNRPTAFKNPFTKRK